jgi:hypothetical protein
MATIFPLMGKSPTVLDAISMNWDKNYDRSNEEYLCGKRNTTLPSSGDHGIYPRTACTCKYLSHCQLYTYPGVGNRLPESDLLLHMQGIRIFPAASCKDLLVVGSVEKDKLVRNGEHSPRRAAKC